MGVTQALTSATNYVLISSQRLQIMHKQNQTDEDVALFTGICGGRKPSTSIIHALELEMN